MKTTYTKNIILITLLLFLQLNCFSQELLSLDSLLIRIESTYPDILKYNETIKATEARTEGAKSWMPPTFSAGANRFPYQLGMMKDKMDPMNQAGLMFSLEQMIPNPSKLTAKERYNTSLVNGIQKNQQWTVNIYKTQGKILYYNRLIGEKKKTVIQENEELLQLFIKSAENKYTYNQAELANIYSLRARLQEIKNMILMAEASIAEANTGINALLNRDPNYSFSIDTSITIKNYDTLAYTSGNRLNRPDIESMESSIRAMELNRELMRVGNKPDFGVRFEHMQMFGMPNQFSVMGMITLPFVPWASKMYRSEVKSMNFEIEAMRKEKETMQIMATRMSTEKLLMVKYELKQLKNYDQNILPAFKQSLDANFISYRQNTGSFSSLIDAWEMLLMKQLERLDKLGNVLKLGAEYEYEIGSLNN